MAADVKKNEVPLVCRFMHVCEWIRAHNVTRFVPFAAEPLIHQTFIFDPRPPSAAPRLADDGWAEC